jgi:hypothetical protein
MIDVMGSMAGLDRGGSDCACGRRVLLGTVVGGAEQARVRVYTDILLRSCRRRVGLTVTIVSFPAIRGRRHYDIYTDRKGKIPLQYAQI